MHIVRTGCGTHRTVLLNEYPEERWKEREDDPPRFIRLHCMHSYNFTDFFLGISSQHSLMGHAFK